MYAWARQWLAEEWDDWAPRTRASQVEGLARFVPLAVPHGAPEAPPKLRAYLTTALPPKAEFDPLTDSERWLTRWSLPLTELAEERLAVIERRLGIGDAGQPLGPNTAGRYRRIAHTCIGRAAELKQIPADPLAIDPEGPLPAQVPTTPHRCRHPATPVPAGDGRHHRRHSEPPAW